MPPTSHALASADAIPTRPHLLTAAFLQEILANGYEGGGGELLQVVGFEWEPLEVGVISEVVAVTVLLRQAAGGERVGEKQLIAKFLRPEFPFGSMFQVESKFYTSLASGAGSSTSSCSAARLPFRVPTPVFTSNSLIVMERVPSVETFTCVQGCPTDQITVLVSKLAQMHARFWDDDYDGLAVPAGIGSGLSGDAKQEQFPDLWAAYLDDVPLESGDKARLAALCERLSAAPKLLAAAHNLVESGPQTLIHGDYHVANILFSTASSTPNVWLLDWATCGKGNPMRDLAFFFIVSVTHDDRHELERSCLKLYHETMSSERSATDEESELLSLAEWTRHYRLCVLNQFLILVVYDHLSKHLAANAKTEKLRGELGAHFRTVNLRACHSVLDNWCGEEDNEDAFQWLRASL
ncbi:hypothetical protein Gpo141_00013191 [Globisporangium polare]